MTDRLILKGKKESDAKERKINEERRNRRIASEKKSTESEEQN